MAKQLQRAGDGIRTHEYQLGRLMPYHLATPACERHFTTIGKTILSHGFTLFGHYVTNFHGKEIKLCANQCNPWQMFLLIKIDLSQHEQA